MGIKSFFFNIYATFFFLEYFHVRVEGANAMRACFFEMVLYNVDLSQCFFYIRLNIL